MSLHGSTEVVVTYDDALGAPQTITCLILELGGAKIEVRTQDASAFCHTWDEHVPTGRRGSPAIKLRGLFDTAANGPHDLFVPTDEDVLPSAPTRTLALTYAEGYTFTVETRLQDYEVLAKNGALTEYVATVQPTGPATWTPAAPGGLRTTRRTHDTANHPAGAAFAAGPAGQSGADAAR
ncbi:MAG TPA: hypothetical protein VJM11_03670 [Nevskiaceae bacterium]|nr:hypothetical protein [Nevskiaceae bacterium]